MERKPPRLNEQLETLSQLPPKNTYADELAKHPIPREDPRPVMIKPAEKVLVPRYNELYDSLRSRGGWEYLADAMASGTITSVVNQTVAVPVTLSADPHWRLEQWPGAVQVYLAIRFFGIVPQATPTTVTGISVTFQDQGGNSAPLGEFVNSVGGNNYNGLTIMPSPITDPGQLQVGSLAVTLPNIATSTATYHWSIGFSAVYLLPARYGYEVLDDEQYLGLEWSKRKGQHEDC